MFAYADEVPVWEHKIVKVTEVLDIIQEKLGLRKADDVNKNGTID